MHSQLHSQTIAALRSEVAAVTTLQTAFNRIAHAVDLNSLSLWEGPRPDEVDDVAQDDGSFSREVITELRARAGQALGARYREVERVIAGRAALESLLRAALHTGTGGVAAQEGPHPADFLNALSRSGALRLDWAQTALTQVKEVLDSQQAARDAAPPKPVLAPAPVKKAAPKKKTPAKKTKKPAKKPVKSKPAAKKTPAKTKKKAVSKKPAAKKKPAKRR